MGDWVKIPASALRHKHTLLLARMLQVSPVVALGYMVAVALWCLDNAASGYLEMDEWDSGIIEDAVGWTGEPGKLTGALTACGFVDTTDGPVADFMWWGNGVDPLSE